MSQHKIHMTRMKTQTPLDIFSHNSMLYSGSSGTCPRKFYGIATLASVAWPSGTNKVVKLSMCTTSTNMLFSTNCHFDLDTGTKFTYFNNIGLLVVGKLSKEKTPF